MMKRTLAALLAAMAAALPASAAWDLWDDFKSVGTEHGRVVDYSDARRITTSEGQSYGLFFALVAGDREAFAGMAD